MSSVGQLLRCVNAQQLYNKNNNNSSRWEVHAMGPDPGLFLPSLLLSCYALDAVQEAFPDWALMGPKCFKVSNLVAGGLSDISEGRHA